MNRCCSKCGGAGPFYTSAKHGWCVACRRAHSNDLALIRKERNLSAECECGRPKDKAADGCSRCRWLDGSRVTCAAIGALRTLGGAATLEQAADAAGKSPRRVLDAIERLARVGRVLVLRDEWTGWPLYVLTVKEGGRAC